MYARNLSARLTSWLGFAGLGNRGNAWVPNSIRLSCAGVVIGINSVFDVLRSIPRVIQSFVSKLQTNQ
jgi:hypothetical protein